MAVNVSDAISAFTRASRLVDQGGAGESAAAATAGGQGNFAQMVRAAAQDVVQSGQKAEAATADAIAGKADLADVVQAVTNAEVTLQTAVAVRDRVLTAYQEVMRMPI